MASSEVMFIALVPNEYIIGAFMLGTLSATSTVRNFPNPRIAGELESIPDRVSEWLCDWGILALKIG